MRIVHDGIITWIWDMVVDDVPQKANLFLKADGESYLCSECPIKSEMRELIVDEPCSLTYEYSIQLRVY